VTNGSGLAPLPVTVLTGFLGSGKTTFLRRALASPALGQTAVVVNELGEIGLDHYLVETVDGPMVELPGGCLCCAVREDLAATLRGLLERRVAGRGPPFRRVVLETTGLADPAPILFTLGADPALDGAFRLARVVTTIDATNGGATLARFPEAARQAALADHLLATKTDLAPLGADLAAWLDALNAGAERSAARDAPDPGAVLFGDAAAARPLSAPPHAVHTHGVAAHAVALPGAVTRLDFARALGGLARERGEDLLRVKGILRFADRPERPAFVQGAQHALYPPIWLDRPAAEAALGRLVFIVHRIPLAEILDRFAFAGARPWSNEGADIDERIAPCSTP
jgi:G3E family GTPase